MECIGSCGERHVRECQWTHDADRSALMSTGADFSHPKYAELGLRNRRVQRRGKRQSEHTARLGGGDDAVVPQPCGGIIGIAFGIVLLADRLLELLLLHPRPPLA